MNGVSSCTSCILYELVTYIYIYIYIGWPVQTSRTIHFDNKSHVYPSPDTLIYRSTDRIYH